MCSDVTHCVRPYYGKIEMGKFLTALDTVTTSYWVRSVKFIWNTYVFDIYDSEYEMVIVK